MRGEFLTLREREFVDAARVAGRERPRGSSSSTSCRTRSGVIIVNTTLLMAAAILLETALSYLGFGVQPPDVSLGKIVSDYQAAFSTRPWLFWWPGVFIIAIALCVNFIGDGLRDAFDPRQKRMPSERAMRRAGRQADRSCRSSTGPSRRTATRRRCDGGRDTGDVVNYHDQRPRSRRRAERAAQPGAVIVTLPDQQTDHRGRGQRRDHGDGRSATHRDASGSSPRRTHRIAQSLPVPRIDLRQVAGRRAQRVARPELPCSPRALGPIPSKSFRASPNAR